MEGEEGGVVGESGVSGALMRRPGHGDRWLPVLLLQGRRNHTTLESTFPVER